MKKRGYWLIGIIFVFLLVWQIFSGNSLIPHFSLNLPLLFIAFLFPLIPYYMVFILCSAAAFILAPLSGGLVYFLSFLGAYLGGVIVFYFLDKETLGSRLVGGILIIAIFYLIAGITSLIIHYPIFLPVLGMDCLGGIIIYSLFDYAAFRIY